MTAKEAYQQYIDKGNSAVERYGFSFPNDNTVSINFEFKKQCTAASIGRHWSKVLGSIRKANTIVIVRHRPINNTNLIECLHPIRKRLKRIESIKPVRIWPENLQ